MKRALLIGLPILAFLTLWIASALGAFNRFPPEVIRAVISDPDLILYSLDPSEGPSDRADGPLFRDYPIVGQTVLHQPAGRKLVADSLQRAARGAWDRAACFNPRHGIRASHSSGTYDILICFECIQAQIFFPDGRTQIISIHDQPATLNQLLAAARVPITSRR